MVQSSSGSISGRGIFYAWVVSLDSPGSRTHLVNSAREVYTHKSGGQS